MNSENIKRDSKTCTKHSRRNPKNRSMSMENCAFPKQTFPKMISNDDLPSKMYFFDRNSSVLLHSSLLLGTFQHLFEVTRVDIQNDVCVHLDEAPIAVEGEATIPGLFGQRLWKRRFEKPEDETKETWRKERSKENRSSYEKTSLQEEEERKLPRRS